MKKLIALTTILLTLASCKSKEKITTGDIQSTSLSQQFKLRDIQLNETIFVYNIQVSDSDTIKTPMKAFIRSTHLQQQDTTINTVTQNKKSQSVEHKARDELNSFLLYDKNSVIELLICLILLLLLIWILKI